MTHINERMSGVKLVRTYYFTAKEKQGEKSSNTKFKVSFDQIADGSAVSFLVEDTVAGF